MLRLLPVLLVACAVPDPAVGDDDDDDTLPVDTGEPCDERMFFFDDDGDGFGGLPVTRCEAEPGLVDVGGDCDDANGAVSPGAEETCNGVDDDCDGEIDRDDLRVALFGDSDGDGLGDPRAPILACPEDGADNDCDCDDTNPTAGDDLFECPALDCPEEGGVWVRQACNGAVLARDLDPLVFTKNASVTLCDDLHAVTLEVDAPAVAIWGQGAENTSWVGTPALRVTGAGSRVAVHDLTVGGAGINNTGWASVRGLLIDARAEQASVSFERSVVGSSSGTIHNATVVEISGDLTLVDTVVRKITLTMGSSYSNSCSYTAIAAGGDLRMIRSAIGEFSLSCGSWTHSAYNELSAVGLWVGGDAVIEESSFAQHSYVGSSSGVGDGTEASVLWVKGDLQATDLELRDNELSSEVWCARYSCDRSLTGGVLRAEGDVSWSGGAVDGNTVRLWGSMAGSGVFDDILNAAPVYWTGGEGRSLVLEDVDLGGSADPDVAGTVEYDGSGVTTVTCTVDGCE